MRITILCHNVLWFQGMPYTSDQPSAPTEPVLNRLCALYRELAPDVLCLQEVQDDATHRKVAASVGMAGVFCPAHRQPQYSGAVYWRHGNLAADSASANARPWRMWQKVLVRAGIHDLVICNIHLPSSRQLDEETAARARVTDLEQILTLSPKPDIIAGDFNEGPGGPSTAFLMQHGYVDSAPLVQSKVSSTGEGKPRSDQIWVSDALQHCVAGFSVMPWDKLKCAIPGKTHLSDHLPLRLDLEIPEA
jgi:exonuclease III